MLERLLKLGAGTLGRAQIGRIRGYRIGPRRHRAGQAHQRRVQIERRQLCAARDHLGYTGAACHQTGEWRRSLHHHFGAFRRHQRRIADELQTIAEPLLGMEQHGAPFRRRAIP